MKGLFKNSCSRLAQKDSAHVDLYDLSSDAILLHTVAHIIELCESCAEFVEVVTQHVGEQVIEDPGNDLGKTDDTFGEF